mgnify:CR=1 FL=1
MNQKGCFHPFLHLGQKNALLVWYIIVYLPGILLIG